MLTPNLVNETVVTTFEEMAFLDVTPGPAAQPAAPEQGPWLSLAYTQPQAGSFALFLPKAVKYAIGEAIYAEDGGLITSIQLDDSLLELLNVLAGRLLSGRFGPVTTYTMGLPVVLYDPPGSVPTMAATVYPFHRDANEFSLTWYEVPS